MLAAPIWLGNAKYAPLSGNTNVVVGWEIEGERGPAMDEQCVVERRESGQSTTIHHVNGSIVGFEGKIQVQVQNFLLFVLFPDNINMHIMIRAGVDLTV